VHNLARLGRLAYIESPHGRLFAAQDLDALRIELDARWPGHNNNGAA
jgi:hypothetical protein